MTRISNADQVLLLLREQLQRAGKTSGSKRKSQTDRAGPATVRPLERVRGLAALDTLNDDEVRRAIIRGILTEELGEAVGNDAAFQATIDNVVRIIGDAPGGSDLLNRAVAQLKENRP
ncbi:MAG: hypothetical protein BVN33_17515 [Proteobacteria bacterium ST_bin13]|nr:MAG: hypothetical protein BVN33_17515 [Proteobacteria bacterium ST_bin13]